MADTKSMMDVTASPINEKMKNALKKEAKKLAEKGMERGDAVAKIHGMGKFSSVDETTIESIFDTEAMTVRRKKEEKATKTSTTSAKPVSTADVPSPTTSTDSATKNGFVKWVKNHPVKTGLIALATVVLAATAITGICHCVKYLGNQEEQPPVVNGFTKEDLDKAKEEGKEEGLVSGKTEGQNEANQQNALQNKRNTLKNRFRERKTLRLEQTRVQKPCLQHKGLLIWLETNITMLLLQKTML